MNGTLTPVSHRRQQGVEVQGGDARCVQMVGHKKADWVTDGLREQAFAKS